MAVVLYQTSPPCFALLSHLRIGNTNHTPRTPDKLATEREYISNWFIDLLHTLFYSVFPSRVLFVFHPRQPLSEHNPVTASSSMTMTAQGTPLHRSRLCSNTGQPRLPILTHITYLPGIASCQYPHRPTLCPELGLCTERQTPCSSVIT